MLRPLIHSIFCVLIFASLLIGQEVPPGQEPPLPGPGSAPASPSAQSNSAQPAVAKAPDMGYGDLSEASRHYLHGEFDAAIQSYNVVLQKNPKSPDAYAGLTRAYLRQKNILQAYETAWNGVKVTDAPTVRTALGEVYFRQGKIPEAEHEWLTVINSGYPSARAYFGLSRVRTALSLYHQAKALLDKAHEIDSSDPDIQRRWIASLSRAEQIEFWEKYLASPTSDDAETRVDLQHHLDYLKALENQPQHTCRLVNHIPSAETKLIRIADPTYFRGYSIAVALNGKKGNLMVDTGTSGIMVNEVLARKAGITKVSDVEIGGIGDKARTDGYVGFANSFKVGELEFQDCRVTVVEKRSVGGEDGVIGMDEFSSFLVDIDFPNEKLRLQPLPKRPDDNPAETGVKTGGQGSAAGADQASAKTGAATSAKSSPPPRRGPRDRYIAPEMQSYTQVYRFGSHLLVPTRIGELAPRLFLVDTGSSTNLMSLEAAEESTKIQNQPNAHLQGFSGTVAKVYTADKAVLQFGRLRQENQDVATFDLSHFSDREGTEISGILGFRTLFWLDIRIDYRDGLVDFIYKPRP